MDADFQGKDDEFGLELDEHPDDWTPGLHLGVRTLNTRKVKRAKTPEEVLPVCLRHSLRKNNADHRHRRPINDSLTHLNQVLVGSDDPEEVARSAQEVLDGLGLVPASAVAIMGLELIAQPPDGWDCPAFWSEALDWARGRFDHVISAVVHRDQRRPHGHILALAVKDGRMAGRDMCRDEFGAPKLRQSFMAHMREKLRLRPGRAAPKSFTERMTSGATKQRKTNDQNADVHAHQKSGVGMDIGRFQMSMPVDVQYCVSLPLAQSMSHPPLFRLLTWTAQTQEAHIGFNISGDRSKAPQTAPDRTSAMQAEVDAAQQALSTARTEIRSLAAELHQARGALSARPTAHRPAPDREALIAQLLDALASSDYPDAQRLAPMCGDDSWPSSIRAVLVGMDGRGWMRPADVTGLDVPAWRDAHTVMYRLRRFAALGLVKQRQESKTPGHPRTEFRFDLSDLEALAQCFKAVPRAANSQTTDAQGHPSSPTGNTPSRADSATFRASKPRPSKSWSAATST